MKKRIVSLMLAAALLTGAASAAGEEGAAEQPDLDLSAASAVLMEKETGALLYEKESHQQLEPASVTKVMTLLLIMEDLDSGRLSKEDLVTVSAAAAGMGGSQVYLKEGEQLSAGELIKCIAVVSGNDAAVAMAEHLAGSEAAFVERMNRRAQELGMKDTVFVNCTGLPAAGHHSSAYDIALMSRELILHHPDIRTYTTIWMDSIRDGAFGLTNTNRLVRFYPGATGLKTGSTDSALYCLSATAERDGMELIAVVMKAPSSAQGSAGLRLFRLVSGQRLSRCPSGPHSGAAGDRGSDPAPAGPGLPPAGPEGAGGGGDHPPDSGPGSGGPGGAWTDRG